MSLASVSQTTTTKAPEGKLVGLTPRAVVLTILLTIATYLGITRLGFIQINWVPYVVPPVPAILFLMILHGLNLLVARCSFKDKLPSWLQPLSRGELILIYAGLAVSLCMERGGYIIHYLLVPKYFATPVNGWEGFFNHYPDYYIPKDARLINQWFEGAPDGRIPWSAWMPFLGFWGSFSLLLVVAVACIAGFFRRQWAESERLTYPLLYLPVEITGGLERKSTMAAFFSNPLMWVGFGLATAFNLLNILHAFFPNVPGIRMSIPLDEKFKDPPLRYLMPLNISMALEVWGLAYLVSGEVLFSTWVFYFLIKIVKLIGMAGGYRAAGFPFAQEMSAGGCIAMAAFMLWVARPHFRKVWQDIVRGPNADDSNEAMSYRWMAIALAASTIGMIAMLNYAGQPLPLLLLYFTILYIFVLVAARVRAEVGPPVVWTHPYGFDQTMPVHWLGTKNIMRMAGPQGTVLFYAMFYIGRTVFAHTTAQSFTDGLRLADHGHVSRRSINVMMILICVVALALTFWFHLDVGYRYGQGLIGAKVGRAGTGWGMSWSKANYSMLETAFNNPSGPDFTRIAFYVAGFLFTGAVTLARTRLTSFPFHPLGFVMATLYGDWSPYWWPFLVAWLAQRLTLRYGSLPAYRKLVPLFLGLTLGHMIVGGVIWRIIINYFIDPSISIRYYVNLGG
jgi:hypothetical protein